jgi:TP901 family phage tail tape measure protein
MADGATKASTASILSQAAAFDVQRAAVHRSAQTRVVALTTEAKALSAQARAIEEGERRNKSFSRSLTAVSGGLQTMGIGFAITGGIIVKVLFNASKAWQAYETQTAKTLTQVDGFTTSVRELGDIGLSVARRLPVAFESIQETLFFILSSIDTNLKGATIGLEKFGRAAVAGQTDMQTAAKGTIAILNAFNVPIENVNEVLDVQFELVRKGVGTYEEFAKVFGQVVPAAARAGQNFETIAAMLAFLTRNGLSASRAATSAARAMEAFAHPTAVGRLEAMGVVMKNSEGNFLPLIDILTSLREKLLAIPAGDRIEAIQDIFKGAGNQIQARRFIDQVLLRKGDLEDFTSLLESMGSASGVMEEKFREMSNTAAVKMQLLSNRWQVLKIAMGEAVTPVLLTLVSGMSRVVDWFNNLSPGVKKIVSQFLIWGAVVSLIIGVLLVLIGLLAGFVAAFVVAGTEILAVLAIIAAVVVAVIGLGAAIIAAWKNSEGFRQVLVGVVSIFKQLWAIVVNTAQGIGQAFSKHLLPPLQKFFQVIEKHVFPAARNFQKMLAEEVIPKVKEAGRIIKSILGKAFEFLGMVIEKVAVPAIQKVSEWWHEHEERLRPLIKAFAQVVKWTLIVAAVFVGILIAALALPIIVIGLIIAAVALLIFAWTKVIQFVKFLAGKIAEFFVGLWNRLVGIWNNIIGVVVFAMALIGKQIAFGIAIVKAIWNSFWNVFGGLFKAIWQLILAIVKLYTTMFTEVWKDWLVPLGRFFVNIWNSITKFFVGVWNGIVRFVSGKWNTLTKLASTAWQLIKSRITGPINSAKDTISSVMSKIRGLWDRGWEAVRKVVVDKLNKARDTVKSKIQVVRDLFKNAKNWLFQAGKNIIQGLIDGVTKRIRTLTDIISGITDLIPQIKGPRERDLRLLQPAGQHIIQGLMRGINDVVPELTSQLTRIGGLVNKQIQPPQLTSPLNLGPVGVASSRDGGASKIVNQYVTVNTGDLDPERQAIELGWLLAARM